MDQGSGNAFGVAILKSGEQEGSLTHRQESDDAARTLFRERHNRRVERRKQCQHAHERDRRRRNVRQHGDPETDQQEHAQVTVMEQSEGKHRRLIQAARNPGVEGEDAFAEQSRQHQGRE